MAISVATADIPMRRVPALVGHDEALSQNSTLTPVFRPHASRWISMRLQREPSQENLPSTTPRPCGPEPAKRDPTVTVWQN
jgi:hypothetical protein